MKIPPAPVPVKKPESHRSTCWSCGAALETPDLDQQIEILGQIQRQRPKVFHWSDLELQRLRDRLEENDVIIFAAIYYSSVKVRRADGTIVEFFRNDA